MNEGEDQLETVPFLSIKTPTMGRSVVNYDRSGNSKETEHQRIRRLEKFHR